MPEYDVGTAHGRIVIDSNAEYAFGRASAASDEFASKQAAASASVTKSGKVMVAGGLIIAAGLGVAIKSASDFETRISAIAAVSGATGNDLDKLREKALQLGRDTKFSAGEAASAMEELVKAGLNTADVLNGAADATVALAAAGEIDLPAAASIAAAAMNTFNLAAQDLPKVADLIAGAANASAIDVNDFAMAMQQSGAVANLAGVNIDDLATAIALMGNAGIKGSDAGTSLKTMLMNLNPVTKKQIDLAKKLGIITRDGSNAFYDQAGSLKPLNEVAQILQDSMAGLTDQQKQMALETLFGSDSIRAAAVIANNGAAGFNNLATEMGKVTAADVAAKRMDNLGGSIEQLRGSVETLLIRIGKPLADALRGVVDRITEVINWFAQLDDKTMEQIGMWAKVVASVLLTVGTFLILVGTINKVEKALGALKAVMMGHPLLLLVVVLAALAVAFYKLYQSNEKFRKVVDDTFSTISGVVMPIIDKVRTGIEAMVGAFSNGDITSDGFVGVMERIGVAARKAVDVMIIVFKWLQANVPPIIDEVSKIIQKSIEVIVAGFNWFRDNVWPVLTAFAGLVEAIVNRAIAIWRILWPFIKVQLDLIIKGVQTFISFFKIMWDAMGKHIWEAIKLVFSIVKTIIETALGVIRGIITTITGIISGDWGKAWDGIKQIFSSIWDGIKQIPGYALEYIKLLISSALDFIKGIWQAAWDLIGNILSGAWDAIKGIASAALNGMQAMIGGIISNIVAFFAALPGRVGGALGDIGSFLLDKGRALVNGLWDGAKEIATNLVTWVFQLPGRILSALGDLASLLIDLGKALIEGLIKGIKSMAGAVGDAIKAVVLSPYNAAKKLLGIGSPSKVFKELGIDTMEGFILGLKRALPDIDLVMNAVVSRMVTGSQWDHPPTVPPAGGTTVNLDFSNGTWGPGAAEAVREIFQDNTILNRIIVATKAGRR